MFFRSRIFRAFLAGCGILCFCAACENDKTPEPFPADETAASIKQLMGEIETLYRDANTKVFQHDLAGAQTSLGKATHYLEISARKTPRTDKYQPRLDETLKEFSAVRAMLNAALTPAASATDAAATPGDQAATPAAAEVAAAPVALLTPPSRLEAIEQKLLDVRISCNRCHMTFDVRGGR